MPLESINYTLRVMLHIEQGILYTNEEKQVLSCHRCLINTGVEKMNYIQIYVRALTTRCLLVRVNVGSQTIV